MRVSREALAARGRQRRKEPKNTDATSQAADRFQFPGTVQEHLAAIVESSDDPIISKDLSGVIRTWNRAAERVFGYTAEEAIGQHISLLAAPDRVDEIPDILQRISRGERVDHYHTLRKTKDGRILAVSLTVSPVRDDSGQIIGASKIARDITSQVQNERALQAANESLRRANADLEQFAYSASHDLKEPLRMVATYSEMLRRKFGKQLDSKADEYIGYIVEGATRMEQLLNDLRAFVQASAHGRQPEQDIDSGESLRRALVNLAAAIETSGARISHGPLPWVRMHQFQMDQLFQNLIGNAIRYRSQEPLRIHVAAERSGASWKFSIRDNGIGIEPQYKEQIFGIFERLHTSTDYPGTGMGLAICERIVQGAGGRIWVDSEPGRGATFFFTIPAGGDRV